jgi:hypothetical protein
VDTSVFDGRQLARLTFPAPGLYVPKVTVTDVDGKSYSQQIGILVHDKNRLDVILRGALDNTTSHLAAQDVTGAMRIATPGARARYEQPLNAIATVLPASIATWQRPALGDLSVNVAEYSIGRIVGAVKKRYFIYLLKDGDGVWRLESM